MTDIPELPTDPAAELVEVEALYLLSWDGDPETEGAEYYAPPGTFHEDILGPDSHPLTDLPSRFTTTRIQAEALVKAGVVKIVSDPAAS